jgi:hypothetical protein
VTEYTLPDGTKIDVAGGSNLPPGATGQHVSRTYWWYRVNGGEWVQTNHRSSWKLREWIELSENLADFLAGEGAAY